MRLTAVLIALCATVTSAFSRQQTRSATTTLRRRAGGGEDPTKTPVAAFADVLQNLLTNSPLNEGKKALARLTAGPYDRDAVGAKLDALIADEPVLMLSFVRWPFCVKAKQLLDAKGARYTVVELDEVADGGPLRAEMGARVDRTSVPAIWIDGAFVGGCNDGPMGGVVSLDKRGGLDPLLAAAGALN